MSIMEIIAVVFSLISIIQTIKQNRWCWVTGIIGICAYCFIFYDQKLYCEMLLQVIFIAQSIYGLVNWGETKEDLPVTSLSLNKYALYAGATALISFNILILLSSNIQSSQPELDVSTTMLSLLATWFLTKKYIDNWVIWILADFLFIIMFINQHLYLSGILYFIFLLLAIKGFKTWKKDLITV